MTTVELYQAVLDNNVRLQQLVDDVKALGSRADTDIMALLQQAADSHHKDTMALFYLTTIELNDGMKNLQRAIRWGGSGSE